VTYNIGDIIDISGTLYEVITAFTLSPGGRISPTDPTLQEVEERFINGFTISYNEFLDSFESFYDFKPGLYYNYGRRLLSVSPFDKNRMYEHNRGNYCQYYGHLYPDSKITFLLNPDAGVAKIFNNIEFQSECTLLGADQYLESITGYRCYNEYQDTGDITLTVPTNLKRRIRQWRFEIGRDESDGKSRIRNPYTFLELKYENGNNRRFILHDIILSYTISRY
jgi:hypothetical protein